MSLPSSDSHYKDVNVLGADFLRLVNAKMFVDYYDENNCAKITGNFKKE